MTSRLASPFRATAGHSVLELLVATAIMLLVTGWVFALLRAADTVLVTEPGFADMQQRLRVVADALSRDLINAGAGLTRGERAGPLTNTLAPVVPYRLGARDADPPGSVRAGRITTLSVPPGAPQATIRDLVAGPLATVRIAREPGCRVADEACGFREGMAVLVFDAGGRFGVFTVVAVAGPAVDLQLRDGALASVFGPGSSIAEVRIDSYRAKTDVASSIDQIAHYDGYRTEQPLADNVVAAFELLGEAQPPRVVRPVTEPGGPWTTYGPRPPAPGVDDPLDTWPAGENCVFGLSGTTHVPRLRTLGAASDGLILLDSAMLADGPWCPDEQAPNRFDADLLRLRRVVVRLRAQALSDALRGPSRVLFLRPGTAKDASRTTPDLELQFDVSPRNMNARR